MGWANVLGDQARIERLNYLRQNKLPVLPSSHRDHAPKPRLDTILPIARSNGLDGLVSRTVRRYHLHHCMSPECRHYGLHVTGALRA
jgi:hypothetical protein